MGKNKVVLVMGFFLVASLVGFSLLKFGAAGDRGNGPNDAAQNNVQQSEIKIRGKVICLPDTQKEGCKIGFKDERGNKYELQNNDTKKNIIADIPRERVVTIAGIFELGEERQNNYLGTIRVKELLDRRLTKPKTKYIVIPKWPPEMSVDKKSLSCDVQIRTIDDRSYCVKEEKERVGERVNKNYLYLTDLGDSVLSLGFQVIMPNCNSYVEPDKSLCDLEVDIFNPDQAISSIVESNNWKIGAELKECLPMSDMGSRAKCGALMEKVTDFEICVQTGLPVQESYPRQCRLPNGKIFVEVI